MFGAQIALYVQPSKFPTQPLDSLQSCVGRIDLRTKTPSTSYVTKDPTMFQIVTQFPELIRKLFKTYPQDPTVKAQVTLCGLLKTPAYVDEPWSKLLVSPLISPYDSPRYQVKAHMNNSFHSGFLRFSSHKPSEPENHPEFQQLL